MKTYIVSYYIGTITPLSKLYTVNVFADDPKAAALRAKAQAIYPLINKNNIQPIFQLQKVTEFNNCAPFTSVLNRGTPSY